MSQASVRAYAQRIGAGYRFFHGPIFDSRLTAPCQKLVMLDQLHDHFDQVAMLDADMVVTPWAANIFEVQEGYGWHHETAFARVHRQLPKLTSPSAPFWGGAVYRLPRDLRRVLRAQYDFAEAVQFNDRGKGEDEGVMHRLAFRAGIPTVGAYFSFAWCQASFADEDALRQAHFIHLRHHPRPKMEQYLSLKARGFIA